MTELMLALKDYATKNRADIEASRECGCYFCMRRYPAIAVVEYIDDGQTAVCPMCLVDAVLPDATSPIDEAILVRMHERWFSTPV